MKKILMMLLLVCGSCQEKRNPQALRISFLTAINSLDPRYGYEPPAKHVMKMLYEGLTRTNVEGEIELAAAQKLEISADQKCYTFTLRPAVWSDGSSVTAFDFASCWRSIIDPKEPTQGASDFYPIKNVEKITRGELPLDEVGIRAIDERTFVVELEHPTPYFLELISTSAFSPVRFNGDELLTNGPFRVLCWRPTDSLLLEKDPTFWNAEAVHLDRIEIAIVEDEQTQLALFEKGETDWFGKPFTKLPLDAVAKMKGLCLFPERAVYLYFFNTERFPFTNQAMRKAFALAVNREQITSHLLQENEQPALAFNSGYTFFEDSAEPEARAYLEQGLCELGLEELPKIKLSYCNIETNARMAAVIQQQWKEVLGVDVQLDPQEWSAYYDNLCSGKLQLAGLSWHARIRDPIYNLQLFKNKQDRLNMSNWEDPHFQGLLDQAQACADPVQRRSLLLEAEEVLCDQMPAIPLYFLSIGYAKKEELKDVWVSDLGEIDFLWARKGG